MKSKVKEKKNFFGRNRKCKIEMKQNKTEPILERPQMCSTDASFGRKTFRRQTFGRRAQFKQRLID
jgi:hypothetical protein